MSMPGALAIWECAPQKRAQHNGELKTLGLVDRHDFDGVVIAIDATSKKFGGNTIVVGATHI